MMMHWLREKLGLKACPGCQTLVDFAMDGLSESEQETVREHLGQCPPCREQVRDYWQVQEGLGLCSKQTEVPQDLCAKVLARLKEAGVPAPSAAPAGPRPRAGGWPRFWMIFGPAFAVLGLVMTLIAFIAVMGGRTAPAPAPADAMSSMVQAIMDDPRSAHVVLSSAGDVQGGEGLLVFSPGFDHACLRVEHLPLDPAGGVYVLWIKPARTSARPLARFTVGAGVTGSLQLLQLSGALPGEGPVEFMVAPQGSGSAPGEALLKGSVSL